ncbi:MAG: hypothetical protein RIF41_40870, partial [Polyangiaceae bacterium]
AERPLVLPRGRAGRALQQPLSPTWLVGSLLPAARNTTRRALQRHADPLVRALADVWQQRSPDDA